MSNSGTLEQAAPISGRDGGSQVTDCLRVRGLTTSVLRHGRWNPVVRDLSFSIAPHETLALVGESGSGKSVTALSIMRLLQARTWRTTGSIAFGGRDILALPEPEMRHVRGNEVAMIFQEPMTSLNPVLTVGFQIAEVLRQHRKLPKAQAEKATIELLEKVRIPAARMRYHEHPDRLSGGMRQRVMIAMALACKPRLLIADEPTTALDVTIQAQILELIKELQDEEGMAVLFITHDMGVVAEVADRMLVMYKGDMTETGDTSAVFGSPTKAYTRALLAAVPRLGSMAGHTTPQRFAIIDKETGLTTTASTDIASTVQAGTRPVLEVSGLTKRFDIRKGLLRRVSGRVHAVESVSFRVSAGETLALVGESGSGKSTTGRAILRLTEPDAGSVVVDGTDLSGLDRQALRAMRRKMQIIFQDPFASLNPRMKVGQAIAAPLLAHRVCGTREALKRADALLDQVGLSTRMASRFPGEFSGGQRQRICIARALALDPKVIIADEAVSALDVSVKAQVINLLLDLQERLGLAYLFISHDIAVVERLSHRVAVMYLGEIVEIGPRAAVLGDPRHPYTRKLIRAVPLPDPSRKGRRNPVGNDEIKSPVRPVDFQPQARRSLEVSPGHFVQEWQEYEWPRSD